MTRRHRIAGHERHRGQASGGWSVSCQCGWVGNVTPSKHAADAAYREHTADFMRTCRGCEEMKHPREMAKNDPGLCKRCLTAKARAWKEANPKDWERLSRAYHLRDKYGITPEEFDAMLAAQDGGCAICHAKVADSRGYRPHVDHCHRTMVVRGILCGRCNRAIGQFGDDPALVRAAAEYLEKPR